MNRCASINARMTSTYIDGPRFTRTHRLQTIVCASCHPYEYIQEKTKKRGIFALHLSNVCECGIVSMHSFALSIDECDIKKNQKNRGTLSEIRRKDGNTQHARSYLMICVHARTVSFEYHELHHLNVTNSIVQIFPSLLSHDL